MAIFVPEKGMVIINTDLLNNAGNKKGTLLKDYYTQTKVMTFIVYYQKDLEYKTYTCMTLVVYQTLD